MDVSGKNSRNTFVISFIDLFSGWSKCFPVASKADKSVATLIMDGIFSRYGAPLQIVTDNGTENVNRIVKETLGDLNISHVTTSVYNPMGNSHVEKLNRTMIDTIAKLVEDDSTIWDASLNQSRAAIEFIS